MKTKFTVLFRVQTKDGCEYAAVHTEAKSHFEAIRNAMTKLDPKKPVDYVAGVFVGWHINKYSGEV